MPQLLPQNTPPSDIPKRHYSVGLVTGISALLLLVVVVVRLEQKKPVSSVKQQATTIISSTPLSYNDFSGRVTSVNSDDQSLSVVLTGTDSSGKTFHKNYLVATDAATVLQELPGNVPIINGETPANPPILLHDISPDATVVVAGSENLAPLANFTATKIILIKN